MIVRVAKTAHLTKRAACEAIEATFDEISKALIKGDKVVISGFGTFYAHDVKEKAVEPFGKSNLRQMVAKHRVISFRSGKPLKKSVW